MRKFCLPVFIFFFLFVFALPVKAAFPDSRPPAPPAVYKLYDTPTNDWGRTHPEYGPVGGIAIQLWRDVNPGQGVYNWNFFDSFLTLAQQKQTAPYPDGQKMTKPVILEIAFWQAGAKENDDGYLYYHVDYTPSWVYSKVTQKVCVNRHGQLCTAGETGHTVGYLHKYCSGGVQTYTVSTIKGDNAIIPPVIDPAWQQAYFDLIRAFGQKYNNDPRVGGVIIVPGLDEEASLRKSGSNCRGADNDFPSDLVFRYKEFLHKLAKVARESFPQKAAYLNMGGQEFSNDAYSAATELLSPSLPVLGLKSTGLAVDELQNQYWYENGISLENLNPIWPVAIFKKYPSATSYAFEDAKFTLHPASWYLETLKVIAGGADWIDWRGEDMWAHMVEIYPTFWSDFVPRYLGKKINEVDSVWIALRETKYGPGGPACLPASSCCYTNYLGKSICMYGFLGDYEFGIHRLDDKPSGKTVPLWKLDRIWDEKTGVFDYEVFDRYTRRTDEATGNQYMYFRVDQNFNLKNNSHIGYRIKVIFKNQGMDKIGIEYTNKNGERKIASLTKGPDLGPVGRFVQQSFDLPDARLGNWIEGADFRLTSMGDGDENVHLVLVEKYTTGPIRIYSFSPGWNELIWEPNDAAVSFSRLPAGCPMISQNRSGWFISFVRNYSFSGSFLPGQTYKIFCRERTEWQL